MLFRSVWTNQTTSTQLGSDSTLALTPSTVSPGDVVVLSVTATDTNSGTVSDTANVTTENTLPIISATTITPGNGVTTSTTLTGSANASDPDGGTPTLSYVWTNQTTSTQLGSDSTLALTPSTVSPGDVVGLGVTATGTNSGTVSDTATVTT